MAKGEEVYADFLLISNPRSNAKTTTLDLPSPIYSTCCDSQVVFTDNIGTDEFKNDITSVLFKYPPSYSAVTMVLQKNISGEWEDVDTLNDNLNGTFYALGFIVDEDNNKYIGYKLNWYLIYGLHQSGTFRVKTNETSVFGSTNSYSSEYCLTIYNSNFADGTVKIETYTNGIRGDITDPYGYFDFQNTNWYNSIRINGMFGFDTSDYEREFVEYDNGQLLWTKDVQTVKYKLKVKPIDAVMHNFLKTDVLQSDEIFITDYNKNNANRHVQTPVIVDGGYEPKWNAGIKVASVEVNMKSALNNLRKKRC